MREANSNLASKFSKLVVVGLTFGISINEVVPPATAALDSVAMLPLVVKPGSRKCTWSSINQVTSACPWHQSLYPPPHPTAVRFGQSTVFNQHICHEGLSFINNLSLCNQNGIPHNLFLVFVRSTRGAHHLVNLIGIILNQSQPWQTKTVTSGQSFAWLKNSL